MWRVFQVKPVQWKYNAKSSILENTEEALHSFPNSLPNSQILHELN